MNPILALSYPEFVVAEELSHILPKTKGFTVAAPMSAQNKGWDLFPACPSHGTVEYKLVRSA